MDPLEATPELAGYECGVNQAIELGLEIVFQKLVASLAYVYCYVLYSFPSSQGFLDKRDSFQSISCPYVHKTEALGPNWG